MNQTYLFWKYLFTVVATIGLYSVLYRENKMYRFFEHLFLGLAAGWTIVALWTETLYDAWYLKIVGGSADLTANGAAAQNGYWAYVLLLPIGIMGYLVFSRKHNWIARIPIGIIVGLWSGQQIQIWFNRYGPQINNSLRPLWPNHFDRFTIPADRPQSGFGSGAIYPADVVSNWVLVFTLVAVLSYFLFSFDVKNKMLKGVTTSGRWLLMVGFGAIFGSTVMMRFSLLIDRMYFVWIEFFKTMVLHR